MHHQKNAARLTREARSILDTAERECRDLTAREQRQVEELIGVAEDKLSVEKQLRRFGGPVSGDSGRPGDRFIRSKGWRQISNPDARGQTWTSGPVDVGTFHAKAGTVFESGQGAGLIPVPYVAPGVVSALFEPPAVMSLIPSEQVSSSNSIRYIVEGTATSGATGVAEGAEKPASDFAYSTVDEPVKKVATSVVASDELLDDSTSVSSYISGRLGLFVSLEEERQPLRGGGTNELVGIFDRGINTYAAGTVDDNAVAIFKAAIGTRGSSNLDPTAVVMHPDNWATTRLLQDSSGQFYGGGPFGSAYGGPNPAAGAFAGASLWGLPVVLSSTVGSGTALLGSFAQAAKVYRRGAATVEVSNSHSDFFLKDLVAIRAEARLSLAVYRPGAFTQVTGLD
jgi:HK97 family phage major capsid protein